jgi:geranylgeranyl diphosphate synthase type II
MNTVLYRRRVESLRHRVDKQLSHLSFAGSEGHIRSACRYVLDGGGKRLRSTLVLLSCQAVGGRAEEALPAAVAVELLHNFTLVHDDIMDNAETRRGRPTVHKRWNLSIAVLVGDVLLGTAYDSLAHSRGPRRKELSAVFTRAMLDVCDGQALDLSFVGRDDVTVREYSSMIGKKTGALIAAASELGGIVGSGNSRQVEALRKFGAGLGRAFQLQDDLLDVVADPRDFGKAVGGDILGGKRTFLLLAAAERAGGADRDLIARVLAMRPDRSPWRSAAGQITAEGRTVVERVRDIYIRCGVVDNARREVAHTTARALTYLDRLPATYARETLGWLARQLVQRSS